MVLILVSNLLTMKILIQLNALTDQILEIAPYLRTDFWVTIWYKYHDYDCLCVYSGAQREDRGEAAEAHPQAQERAHNNIKCSCIYQSLCPYVRYLTS